MNSAYCFAERYHDISAGHRVTGHESKCRHLHGHNYRIHFSCEAFRLDDIGRVVDFGVIKSVLCAWLEENWDHRFLIWQNDPLVQALTDADPEGVVITPFNPTAENMALFLLHKGAELMPSPHLRLVKVRVEETRKCSAEVGAR